MDHVVLSPNDRPQLHWRTKPAWARAHAFANLLESVCKRVIYTSDLRDEDPRKPYLRCTHCLLVKDEQEYLDAI